MGLCLSPPPTFRSHIPDFPLRHAYWTVPPNLCVRTRAPQICCSQGQLTAERCPLIGRLLLLRNSYVEGEKDKRVGETGTATETEGVSVHHGC